MNEKKIAQKKIAFFDSGVGGLTVFEKLKKILPNENYIYFGDLIKIADKIFKFLETKDVKAVVMACNTTSANTYEELKDKYKFKIYPIIQSCAEVISKMPLKKIGVFATEATIKSRAYSEELKKYKNDLQVFEMSCPPWVNIVESGTQDTKESFESIKNYLDEMMKNSPDKIILGCTHYPYLLNVLGKIVSKDMFIDPSIYFAEYIKNDLAKNNLLNATKAGSEEFLVSANPDNFLVAASMFYPLSKRPELVVI